jgi:atypical dual specificity phosphatase
MLHKLGIRAVVTLVEQPLPPGLLEQWDLHAEHIPIPDFTAPALEQVAQAVAAIDHFLDDGRAVAVHCGAGLGRTGTILACYLVAQGLSSDEALATVRAQQPGSVETPEQEAVIVRYAQYLAEQSRSRPGTG